MIVFEINKDNRNIFLKVWNEIYVLFFFNIGLIIGNVRFFSSYLYIIEICLFFLLINRLLSKKNKHVYKVELDVKEETLKVYYYQFVVLKFMKEIPLKLLEVNYNYKVYMRGKVPKTLEIKRNKKLVVEIRQEYNIGWTNEEIDRIYESLITK
jgi:hypothetical protein